MMSPVSPTWYSLPCPPLYGGEGSFLPQCPTCAKRMFPLNKQAGALWGAFGISRAWFPRAEVFTPRTGGPGGRKDQNSPLPSMTDTNLASPVATSQRSGEGPLRSLPGSRESAAGRRPPSARSKALLSSPGPQSLTSLSRPWLTRSLWPKGLGRAPLW